MRIQFSLLAIAAATQVGATDCGQVLRDPGFDLWCGEDLCTWKVVRGDAKRVDTWHEGDSGVELIGDDAAIAQLSPVNHGDGTCIEFDFVANVAENANAKLGFDVYGDGTFEAMKDIPTSKWKLITYKVRIASPFTGIRFELSKRGPGKAVFAEIAAEIATDCEGLDEVKVGPAPLGAFCIDDTSCESKNCRLVDDPHSLFGLSQRCAGCDPGGCGVNEACGVADPVSPVLTPPVRCVPAGADELAEQCASDAECASGICFGGTCSTCRASSGSTCTNNEVCGAAWPHGPFVCSPGGRARASGEACATDADCASEHCNGGERKACSDGRPCGNDTNCPVESGLVPGACTTVGIQGGSCA